MTAATGQRTTRFMASANDQSLPVFERLGMIVRALHDALNEIGTPDVVADAATGFPPARERLLHIASLTENAANTVLSRVEETTPLLDKLGHKAAQLSLAWEDTGGAADAAPAVARAATTRAFLAEVAGGCGVARAALSDIMMAQDFQDLTGQLIKKVTALMERTENDLLKLLIDAAPSGATPAAVRVEETAGPGAPGHVALDQQSVDDLLADLGF